MENKIIKYGFCSLALAGLLLASCKKESIETFTSEPSLYFHSGYNSLAEGGNQTGSLNYSFFYTESTLTEDILWVDVRLTGDPTDQDRPIRLVQSNTGGDKAAVAGEHYVAFTDPRMVEELVMPAGQVRTLIPIIVNKTDDMETSEFTLEFSIAPNDFFVAGIKEKSSFTVTMTAMAVKPPLWDTDYQSTFGTWGQVKMRFIIDYLGFSDFEIELGSNYDLRRYLGMKVRELLAQYEADHGLLYETDNSVVSFDV